MFRTLKEDLDAVMERDPAARSRAEVFFLYSGFKAVRSHRKANWCYRHNLKFLARWISQRSRKMCIRDSIYPPTHGKLSYKGKPVNLKHANDRFNYSKVAQIIFQDPYASLDPRMTVSTIIEEGMVCLLYTSY